MGSIDMDRLDRVVGLLILAQEHGLVLARNGDKLKMSQAVKHEDPNLDIIFRTLAANKESVLAIMEDSAAVRQWLDLTQQHLINLHNELYDMRERWIRAEKMYLSLHPDNQGCLCAPGQCRDEAVVRCDYCAYGLSDSTGNNGS